MELLNLIDLNNPASVIYFVSIASIIGIVLIVLYIRSHTISKERRHYYRRLSEIHWTELESGEIVPRNQALDDRASQEIQHFWQVCLGNTALDSDHNQYILIDFLENLYFSYRYSKMLKKQKELYSAQQFENIKLLGSKNDLSYEKIKEILNDLIKA